MRVIHTTLCSSNGGGGIAPVIWALSREMSLTGVDCVVATPSEHSTAVERRPGCMAILADKGLGTFGFSRGLYNKIAASIVKDSIVHSHGLWTYPGIVARKAAERTGAPLVISTHGMLDPWALRHSALKKRAAAQLFENRNLHRAACLHALSEAEAESYRDYGLLNPICIIPNGIDLPERGEPKVESRNPPWHGHIAPGRKVLLFLSRIHPKKGLVNLLKAWAAVRKADNRKQNTEEWVLALAGWDQRGHEDELKHLATEAGLAWADVREKAQSKSISACSNERSAFCLLFLGPQFDEAKAACYANCDAFILPSLSEGLPMVILEAWAHGKPILMTPECHLPEGFVANAAVRIETNVESIVRELSMFLGMADSTRQQMGQAGLAVVRERFSWPKVAAEMKSVYEWVLGAAQKPDCVVLNSREYVRNARG